MTPINWNAVRDDVSRYLQELIQIDTTNPPGNEIEAAEYLAGILRDAGYAPIVLESEPKRGTLVARLTGSGEKAPLLLMSHTDVVPAESEHWTHSPFGGEIHDDMIWGRGTLDMKGTVASMLTLMLLFKRRQEKGGAPLKRDLIFMAAADEERGGTLGAGWMVDNHPDLIRAEYAINEGGGRAMKFGDALYYTCQTAEKGYSRFTLTATGEPGHGSIPRDDNAVVRLTETVSRIGRATLPTHITDTVRTFITTIADDQPDDLRTGMMALLQPERAATVLPELDLSPEHRRLLFAITRNTATPTVLDAGSKINVIPSSAAARVDGRLLPGFDQDSFYAEVEPLLSDKVTLDFIDWGPPLESPQASPLYDTVEAVVAEYEPEATLVPAMITGGTDAKHVTRLGTKIYGFTPSRWSDDEGMLDLAHSHDERISVENLLFRTQMLYDVVDRFART